MQTAIMKPVVAPKRVSKCDKIDSRVSVDNQLSINESYNCESQLDSLTMTSHRFRAKDKAIRRASCRHSPRLLTRSYQQQMHPLQDPFQNSSPNKGSMVPNIAYSRNTRRRDDYTASSGTTNSSRRSSSNRRTRSNSRVSVDCGILPSE